MRPTNVWGPWHWRYPQEFWRIAAKGIYFHPGGAPVRRCYAHVGNVVWQMLRILELPEEQVNRQAFYVGDEVDDIYGWASGFCLALCGRPAPKIPRPLLRAIALAGDAITAIRGKPFYLTSSRYRSMTSDYPTPMAKTFEIIGKGPFTLQQGIDETVKWLRAQGKLGVSQRFLTNAGSSGAGCAFTAARNTERKRKDEGGGKVSLFSALLGSFLLPLVGGF